MFSLTRNFIKIFPYLFKKSYYKSLKHFLFLKEKKQNLKFFIRRLINKPLINLT